MHRPSEHLEESSSTPKLATQSPEFAAAVEELDRKLGLSPEAREEVRMHVELEDRVTEELGTAERNAADLMMAIREELATTTGSTVDGYMKRVPNFVQHLMDREAGADVSNPEAVTVSIERNIRQEHLRRASGRTPNTAQPWAERLAA